MANVKSCKLEATWDSFGRPRKVRGPAYRMIKLPVGAKDKHGDTITKYTPDWARIDYELLAPCITMQSPRQSGHEIEGRVKIRGKSYSAFTSGGDDGRIIVRTKK